jgi:hypothetical protein
MDIIPNPCRSSYPQTREQQYVNLHKPQRTTALWLRETALVNVWRQGILGATPRRVIYRAGFAFVSTAAPT